MVPTYGGLSILTSFLLIFLLFLALINKNILNMNISKLDIASIIVILLYAVFGLIDDIFDIGRLYKIIFPFFFSYPLSFFLFNQNYIHVPFFGDFFVGYAYPLLIVPIYIMVVSNLINMHSGFNGLAMGLSAILLGTVLIKSIIIGKNNILLPTIMFGCLLGFLYYNFYPSKIFEGNVGSFSVGATIGISIILNNFIIAGVVMLIPHIVNFLMYVFWRVMRKLQPYNMKWRLVKFGKVNSDGSLNVPNPFTLKWILPYYFKISEFQVVVAMYLLTLVFCMFSLFIHY